MTKDQESYFGMTLKVKNYYQKNITSIAVIPVIASYFDTLNQLIDSLILADTGSRADLTGYAMQKANKRTTLETLCLRISNALSAHAVVIDDVVLRKRADFPTSKWYNCSEEELVTHANVLKDLVQPYTNDIAPYGVNATDVAAHENAINQFINVISDPTLATDKRKEDNKKLLGTIDAIRTLFADKLDVLMRSFEVNNPTLYALYQSARAIDVNGSVMAPTSIVDAAPQAITTLHTATAYNENTLYTFQNMGNAPVMVSLATQTNTEGEEKILLGAGETRSRMATNLAAMGTYLVANNTNATPVKIRVWVE
ncbi:MAG: hypothetical protein ACRCS4_00265 [Flavobacterium sp.]